MPLIMPRLKTRCRRPDLPKKKAHRAAEDSLEQSSHISRQLKGNNLILSTTNSADTQLIQEFPDRLLPARTYVWMQITRCTSGVTRFQAT